MPKPELNRRRLIGGAAVGAVSLPLLAACGGGGNSTTATQGSNTGGSAPSSGSSGSTQGGSGSSSAKTLVATAKVPVGEGVVLTEANIVVTQPTKGTFKGFSATCTHQGCQVASVAAGTINCPCHGSQFNITDGANVTGPSGSPAGSVSPLPAVAIKVQGKNIVQA